MPERLLVLGGGGHAAVVIETAISAGFDVVGVFDDDVSLRGRTILEVPVLGSIGEAASSMAGRAVVAVGDNAVRLEIARRVNCELAVVAHPNSTVAESATVGGGTVLFAGAVVQSRTVLGNCVILNSGAIVDHDCRIGDGTHVAPGATICGGVATGTGVLVGAGATIAPGVSVGEAAVVGAGALVLSSISAGSTVVGVPAHRIGRE